MATDLKRLLFAQSSFQSISVLHLCCRLPLKPPTYLPGNPTILKGIWREKPSFSKPHLTSSQVSDFFSSSRFPSHTHHLACLPSQGLPPSPTVSNLQVPPYPCANRAAAQGAVADEQVLHQQQHQRSSEQWEVFWICKRDTRGKGNC